MNNKTYESGKIIIPKPCSLATTDKPCLGIIEWKYNDLLMYKFDIHCVNANKDVAESVIALSGYVCAQVAEQLGLPRSTDGWWTDKDTNICYALNGDGERLVESLKNKFHARHTKAKKRAEDMQRRLKRSGQYLFLGGKSYHDW